MNGSGGESQVARSIRSWSPVKQAKTPRPTTEELWGDEHFWSSTLTTTFLSSPLIYSASGGNLVRREKSRQKKPHTINDNIHFVTNAVRGLQSLCSRHAMFFLRQFVQSPQCIIDLRHSCHLLQEPFYKTLNSSGIESVTEDQLT